MLLQRLLLARLILAGLCVVCGDLSVSADDRSQPQQLAHQLLYPAKMEDVPASLRPYVTKLLDARQGRIDPGNVKPSGVFARVVTRKYIIENGVLKKGGTLGSRPFVFVTLPEAIYGRSLLQVFSTIGYSADEVITGQLGVEKVAVIFRWENPIATHPGRDGHLPDEWQSHVYPATWDNLFALVERMVGDDHWHFVPEKNSLPTLMKLRLRSSRERQFVLGFPDAGKQRIKSSSYYALRDIKGADWEYRQFLERSMSLAEHFSGDGTSKATFSDPSRPVAGFPEFVGPNRELATLPQVAVVGLGALRITH